MVLAMAYLLALATCLPAFEAPDQLRKVAKEAGMGYMLFLTKHHDGFCLWDTKTTERKVTNHPFNCDVLAEHRKSCDKFGLKLALYFSLGEFRDNKDYHPVDYTPEMKKAQLTELLTQYGPIEFLWLDAAQANTSASNINDGDRYTGWSADLKAREAWVTEDLQAECEVSQVMFCDFPYIRTQEFDLEAKIGSEWKQIASGTTIRRELWIDFPPIKAQQFRLNLRKTSSTPFLAEFRIIGKV